MNYMEFSILRERAGLTSEQVASKTGYSVRTIYRWENGEVQPRKAVVELLCNVAERRSSYTPNTSSPTFSFIDLFAGIGGLRRGFESIGGECVFTSEWNRYAQQTYRANYRCDHEIAGDITMIPARDIPEHDVLLAGFPCQPFSIAGVSKKNSLKKAHGFRCEAQGTLFFDVARILEYHRPRAFLLENVKNLLNHDRGQTFRVIHKTLTEELRYHVQYRVIDAKAWVPQHRERIFIVGFRDRNDFSFDALEVPSTAHGPRLRLVLHPEDGSEHVSEFDRKYLDAQGRVLTKYTLTDKLWAYLQSYADRHREKGNGFGYGVFDGDDIARTLSARYYKDGSEILIKQSGGKNPRRLTPRECARLMGFDRPGEGRFIIPVSDTQAYKQFGNAVVVPVVEAVARHMAPWIGGTSNVLNAMTAHPESVLQLRQLELWPFD